MTNFEKETNINYNAGENFATVYSANDSDIRRFDKLVAEHEEVTCTRCVTALDNSHTELNAYIKVSNPASSFGTRIDGSFAYFSSAKKSTVGKPTKYRNRGLKSGHRLNTRKRP